MFHPLSQEGVQKEDNKQFKRMIQFAAPLFKHERGPPRKLSPAEQQAVDALMKYAAIAPQLPQSHTRCSSSVWDLRAALFRDRLGSQSIKLVLIQ